MGASASSILLIVPKKRGNRVGGLGGCGGKLCELLDIRRGVWLLALIQRQQ